MIASKRILIAALTPLMILSLKPACFAGNEPVPAQPGPKTQPYQKTIDRPEMAEFKRFQGFAFKFRQRLTNMETMLEQAKRVGTISSATYKKLRARLDHFLEMEPTLARNDWNQKDVEDFEKQLQQYNKDFASGDSGTNPAAQNSDKAGAQSKTASTEKTKTEPTKPKVDAKSSKIDKPGASKK